MFRKVIPLSFLFFVVLVSFVYASTVFKEKCKVIPVGRTFRAICKNVPKEIIAQTAPPYLEIEAID